MGEYRRIKNDLKIVLEHAKIDQKSLTKISQVISVKNY